MIRLHGFKQPMKVVYLQVMATCLILIDFASRFPLAYAMDGIDFKRVCSILETWFIVLGHPDSILSHQYISTNQHFDYYCRNNNIDNIRYQRGTNVLVETAAREVNSMIHECAGQEEEINKRLYIIRTRTNEFQVTPYDIMWNRFNRQFPLKMVTPITSKSPRHKDGVSFKRQNTYIRTINKLRDLNGRSTEYLLIGGSNSQNLELTSPTHPIFRYVNFRNMSLTGLSVNTIAEENYLFNYLQTSQCPIMDEHNPTNSLVIIFIGANDYSPHNYNRYAKHFLKAMIKLTDFVHPDNVIILTTLPRTYDENLHRQQMEAMTKLGKELVSYGFRLINTYEAIPESIRKPNKLFGKKSTGHDARHYSLAVRRILHALIAAAIQLDIQHQWSKRHNPWVFENLPTRALSNT